MDSNYPRKRIECEAIDFNNDNKSSKNGISKGIDPNDLDDVSELNFKEVPQSKYLKNKAEEIKLAIENGITYEKWVTFALSEGGLVNDSFRKIGWPALLNLDPNDNEEMPTEESLKKHPEYSQVVLDVNRSLKRFPPGIPYDQRVSLQDQLTNLILRVITKYPHLHYYQGYHDVAITFLLVVGEEMAFRIMERLSTDHVRDCMEPTMEKTSHLLNYIFPLIEKLNPELSNHLEKSGAGTMFCLPWFLTWFGHSLNHYKDVVRLYDFFLATPPRMPLYMIAVIVAERGTEILATECDMASIHCLLSELPDDLPFDDLVVRALELYKKYSPESVEKEVQERILIEKQQRAAEERASRHRRKGLKDQIMRLVPNSRTRLLLLAVSFAIGLYAFLKGDQGPIR